MGLHIQLIRQKSHTKHPSRLEANCPLLWKGGTLSPVQAKRLGDFRAMHFDA